MLANRKRRSVLVDLRHHRVVVDPHDPDRDEARRVGDVGRPDVRESLAQIRTSPGTWASTLRISSVAAIAKTPSANVSRRVGLNP